MENPTKRVQDATPCFHIKAVILEIRNYEITDNGTIALKIRLISQVGIRHPNDRYRISRAFLK